MSLTYFVRTITITRVILVALWRYWRDRSPGSLGRIIRDACQKLDVLFIKFGQMLSTRYDLLNKEDAQELQLLLDKVPPVSWDVVRTIFYNDFGTYPEKIFAHIDTTPIASASISQVYKATLHSGESVAVKVRRPAIDRHIKQDISILKSIVFVVEVLSSKIRFLRITEAIDEFNIWIHQEIDFLQEAKNTKKIKHQFAQRAHGTHGHYFKNIVIPSTHDQWCSTNIIALDFIEGIPVKDYQTIADDPKYDIRASLANYSLANIRLWLDEYEAYFSADPHPANILILPHGQVAMLDFGLIGYMDSVFSKLTSDVFMSIYARDTRRCVEASLTVCNVQPDQFDDLVQKITPDIQSYIHRSHNKGIAFWFVEWVKIFIKHRIPIPFTMLLLARQNIVIDGVFETAIPGTSTIELLGTEFRYFLRQKIINNIRSTPIDLLIYNVSKKIQQAPHLINTFIDTYIEHPLDLIKDIRQAIAPQ